MSSSAASSPKFDLESFTEALCDDDDISRLVRLSNFTFPDDFVKLELAAGALNAHRMLAFAEALHSRSWSHIAELNLEFNLIHETGAEALASALKFNKRITSINLGHCLIRDRGAAAIAAALIQNKDITFLGMSGNKIGDSGALALSKAIADNISITALDLESNEIGLGWFSSGKDDLASILATCQVCQRRVIFLTLTFKRFQKPLSRQAHLSFWFSSLILPCQDVLPFRRETSVSLARRSRQLCAANQFSHGASNALIFESSKYHFAT